MLQQMTYQQAYEYCSDKSDSWLILALKRGLELGLKWQTILCADLLLERGYSAQAVHDPFGDPLSPEVIPVEVLAKFKDWLFNSKKQSS